MTVKASVTIPDDVYEEVKKLSDNFSFIVAEALKEYLRKKKIEKAVGSFGTWETREESSADIVNNMRKEDIRRNARRHR